VYLVLIFLYHCVQITLSNLFHYNNSFSSSYLPYGLNSNGYYFNSGILFAAQFNHPS